MPNPFIWVILGRHYPKKLIFKNSGSKWEGSFIDIFQNFAKSNTSQRREAVMSSGGPKLPLNHIRQRKNPFGGVFILFTVSQTTFFVIKAVLFHFDQKSEIR